jgi:ABC-type antimicrobial peptide transport system permease subunit
MFKVQDGEFKALSLASVNANWFRIFGIPLIGGRLWDDETDDFYQYNLIVTESVLKLYGITDFSDALLQSERRIWESSLRPKEEMDTNPPYRIVGVVKDFDYMHLSRKSEPMAFMYSPKYSSGSSIIYRPLTAAIVPERTQEAIAFLKNLHDETVGDDFSYSFVEDEVREMYKEDKRIATVYSIFTFIAIFISALGLLSMSLFDIQQRRKEIAIRKINGATIRDIIGILLKKYFLTLFVSFAIAAPVALYAINLYLENFAHKTPGSWWLYAATITLTAAISLLTLLYQTQKAAYQNPAEVVKNE